MNDYRCRALFAAGFLCVFGCSPDPAPGNKKTEAVLEMVVDTIAAKDVSRGTTIINSLDVIGPGHNTYVMGQEPKDIFPYNWVGLTKGKKIARDLKKGERVQRTDILEPDGSPFRVPEGVRPSGRE